MERNSFVFYRSFYESTAELDDESRLVIYDALLNYALNGIFPELKGALKTIFLLIKPQIDANNKKFINAHKGAEHGAKGGRPRKEKTPQKPQQNPTETAHKPPMRNEKCEMRNEKGEMLNEDNNDIYVLKNLIDETKSVTKVLKNKNGTRFETWLAEVKVKDPEVSMTACPDILCDEAVKIGFTEQFALTQWPLYHDYWTARAGANGVKRDWLATWRNWLRNSNTKFGGSYSSQKKKSSIDAQMEDILQNGW